MNDIPRKPDATKPAAMSPQFYQAPAAVIERVDLSSAAVRVAIVLPDLIRFAGPSIGFALICRKTGLERKTAMRAVTELESKGFLIVDRATDDDGSPLQGERETRRNRYHWNSPKMGPLGVTANGPKSGPLEQSQNGTSPNTGLTNGPKMGPSNGPKMGLRSDDRSEDGSEDRSIDREIFALCQSRGIKAAERVARSGVPLALVETLFAAMDATPDLTVAWVVKSVEKKAAGVRIEWPDGWNENGRVENIKSEPTSSNGHTKRKPRAARRSDWGDKPTGRML